MRVITGKARGVQLKTPEGMLTRPTADRVKEALFSIINFDIPGAKVLDLFGGTGQLGIEALSRGATSAVFVDARSPGGSVTAGMAIYDTMRYIKCDVATICVGLAASMGAFLLSAGTKGKRMALPNSEIMIHQPSAGTQGQITDMAIHMKRLQTIKDRMNRILAENCGQDIETVTAACERDNFMTAEEAMQFGLIDRVLAHH